MNQALQQTAGHDSFFVTTAHRCPAAAELGRSAARGLRMQRVLIRRFVATVVGVCGAVLIVGCSKPPAATPPTITPTAEQLPRERSKLFAQITAKKPFADELKAFFAKKFPNRVFKVSVFGPMTASTDGKVQWHQVEVQLFAEDASDRNALDEPLIMEDLKVFMGGLVVENGMELKGPVNDKVEGGKKLGFSFEYKSATHSGSVRVGDQKDVLGGILMSVSEKE
jgi:hypothetical protein